MEEKLTSSQYAQTLNESRIKSLEQQLKAWKEELWRFEAEVDSVSHMKKKFKRQMGKLNEEMKHIKKGELQTMWEDVKEYKRQIQVLKEMHRSQEIEARAKNTDNKHLRKKIAKLEKILTIRG